MSCDRRIHTAVTVGVAPGDREFMVMVLHCGTCDRYWKPVERSEAFGIRTDVEFVEVER